MLKDYIKTREEVLKGLQKIVDDHKATTTEFIHKTRTKGVAWAYRWLGLNAATLDCAACDAKRWIAAIEKTKEPWAEFYASRVHRQLSDIAESSPFQPQDLGGWLRDAASKMILDVFINPLH